MNAHVSIAFMGEFRPIHVEAETLESAVSAIKARVTGQPLEMLADLWRDFARQREAGISIVSASSEYGRVSVLIRDYKRDPWLDSITENFPVSPYERGEG